MINVVLEIDTGRNLLLKSCPSFVRQPSVNATSILANLFDRGAVLFTWFFKTFQIFNKKTIYCQFLKALFDLNKAHT